MSLFWIIFVLAWGSYAAFIGLTGFLVYRVRGPQPVPYIGVSVLILVPTLIELYDQNAYQWARGLTYRLSMGAMALLIASWFASRSLPDRLAKLGRAISAVTFAMAVLWSLGGPCGFFLPLLFSLLAMSSRRILFSAFFFFWLRSRHFSC